VVSPFSLSLWQSLRRRSAPFQMMEDGELRVLRESARMSRPRSGNADEALQAIHHDPEILMSASPDRGFTGVCLFVLSLA
jgi:hypothetical protein